MPNLRSIFYRVIDSTGTPGPILEAQGDSDQVVLAGLAPGTLIEVNQGASLALPIWKTFVVLGSTSVGGYAVGQVGSPGSLYSGFRLVEGDDFDEMPTRWNGGNLSGRYSSSVLHRGFRGTNENQDRMMYIDPAYRGARSQSTTDLGYDGLTIEDGVAKLTASPVPTELVPYLPTTYVGGRGDANNRPQLMSTGLKTGPSFMFSAGSDFVIEAKVRLQGGNIRGYWPSFWTSTFFWPDMAELDIMEAKKNPDGSGAMTTLMNFIANSTDGGSANFTTEANPAIPANRWVTLAAKRVGDTLAFFDDIAIEGVMAQRVMITDPARIQRMRGAHDIRLDLAVSTVWDGSTFNIADWPASVEFDWWRAWAPETAMKGNEATHILPAIETTPGGSWNATIPSLFTLYGEAPGVEQVTAAFDNFDSPGMPTRNSTTKLPSSMTVDLASRTVSGTVPTTEGGAMGVFITYAYEDGSPAKRVLLPYYVAPAVQSLPASWSLNPGSAVNITIPYTAFHSGNLGHTYSVSAPGLTVTGNNTTEVRITGTATSTTIINISATNSRGQTTSVTRTLNVVTTSFGFAYETWSGAGWYDMSDMNSMTVNPNGTVSTISNKRSGNGNLTALGPQDKVLISPAQMNNRQAVRVTRDAANTASVPRLEAPANSLVSQLFVGDDKPYVVIIAYQPLDTNSVYVWSATAGLDDTNDQTIALIRRPTNSSVRRRVNTALNDVTWGSGQAGFVPRIVAVKHTGKAVTVWDNSLNKTVTSASQDYEPFNAALQFMIGAARTSTTSFSNAGATVDYYETIIDSATKTDAEIEQAISDLSTKWGIPVDPKNDVSVAPAMTGGSLEVINA